MEDRIFFMHIAKTAGSYLNQLFINEYGEDRVLTHVETKLRNMNKFKNDVAENRIKVFSGHVYYTRWKEIATSLGVSFKNIAVVREPVSHIASHLLWLDHYNLPEKKAEYQALGESHRRLVDLIGAIKFDNIGDLDHFMTHLPAAGIQMLDNCQSRYFLCGPGSPVNFFEPITLSHANTIVRATREFEFIMLQDNLDEHVVKLNSMLGTRMKPIKERINEAKSPRRIDTSNPIIRSILSKRLTVDSWLWRHVNMLNAEKKSI